LPAMTTPVSYARTTAWTRSRGSSLDRTRATCLDGRAGYHELVGDFAIGEATGDETEHLELALGELRERLDGDCAGRAPLQEHLDQAARDCPAGDTSQCASQTAPTVAVPNATGPLAIAVDPATNTAYVQGSHGIQAAASGVAHARPRQRRGARALAANCRVASQHLGQRAEAWAAPARSHWPRSTCSSRPDAIYGVTTPTLRLRSDGQRSRTRASVPEIVSFDFIPRRNRCPTRVAERRPSRTAGAVGRELLVAISTREPQPPQAQPRPARHRRG
jgi:hypothetical protein